MSDPPRQPAEPAETEARTLARIQNELAAFWRAGASTPPEQALARIMRILAAAGYATPGAEGDKSERFLRQWFGEDGRPD